MKMSTLVYPVFFANNNMKFKKSKFTKNHITIKLKFLQEKITICNICFKRIIYKYLIFSKILVKINLQI